MMNLDLAQDLPLLAGSGAGVAHNPSSNCKLGSGIAAVKEMLAAGVNAALGTDGTPCANTYDLVREMDLASKLQTGKAQSAGVLRAETVLEMATIDAARALSLKAQIGSLEIGKKADFIVFKISGLGSACTPWGANQVFGRGMNPITAVVHSFTGRDVDTVVVGGKVLVRNGKLVCTNELELIQEAREYAKDVRHRSGVWRRRTEM